MHEAGLAAALAEELLEIARREGGRILRFSVEIGALSGVDPEAFRLAYEALRETVEELRETEMQLVMVPGRFRCQRCGREFEGDYFALCPGCGDPGKSVLSGEELLLREVELDV